MGEISHTQLIIMAATSAQQIKSIHDTIGDLKSAIREMNLTFQEMIQRFDADIDMLRGDIGGVNVLKSEMVDVKRRADSVERKQEEADRDLIRQIAEVKEELAEAKSEIKSQKAWATGFGAAAGVAGGIIIKLLLK